MFVCEWCMCNVYFEVSGKLVSDCVALVYAPTSKPRECSAVAVVVVAVVVDDTVLVLSFYRVFVLLFSLSLSPTIEISLSRGELQVCV